MKSLLLLLLTFAVLQLNGQVYLDWATSTGGIGSEVGNSIAIDEVGNIYTAGFFHDTVDFDPGPGVFNMGTTGTNGTSIFVQKLDPNGNFIWAKAFNGDYNMENAYITVDQSNNVYVTGRFWQSADFDPGPNVFTMTNNGLPLASVFVAKLDEFGDFEWAYSNGPTYSFQ